MRQHSPYHQYDRPQAALGRRSLDGGTGLQRAGPCARLEPDAVVAGFLLHKWQVASTIIGVTSVAQLDEDLDVWGTTLSPELLQQIDALRWNCAIRRNEPVKINWNLTPNYC